MDTMELLRLATRAPSADNSQPWAFTQQGDTLTCHYAHPGNFRDPFGPTGHASLLAAGTLHENLELITDGQVEYRLDGSNDPMPWQLTLRPAGVSLPSPELCRTIEGRHTNRHPFDKRAVGPLPDCPPSPGVRIITCTESARIHALGDALQLCSRLPALFGQRATYATIAAVETFVERHYQQQIDHLRAHAGPDGLLPLLLQCQADERAHRDEAASLQDRPAPWPLRAWCALVGAGSAAAVTVARRL